ncbi:MAG: alpha-L-arabinofuranosidase C-terminal domain-containing protein, partial [Ginsengibacter sp.]
SLLSCNSGKEDATNDTVTTVQIDIPNNAVSIDPMIYGQMLEFCNDRIIYDGIVNNDGSERPHVDSLLRPLHIPVVRWPAGTYIFEYNWRNSIGPLDKRPVTKNIKWGGENNNRFGTDEFIAWCKKIETAPYINFNMGNRPGTEGTLEEALNWVEYVNGSAETPLGKMRAANGHTDPYQVKYWGIGNENYGGWGESDKESDTVYADKLYEWASAIKNRFPDVSLLGVGHTYNWNKKVLEKNNNLIDFLTQHYYVSSKYKDNKIIDPANSLFAPAKIEAHLQKLAGLLNEANQKSGRNENPVRLSIDEWNNRHSVFENGDFKFTRQDLRRQSDVAIVAQVLNVFIRQSPNVGMANYIFPVNAHGLIRTVGDTDAYEASIYYVFEQYRNWMTGKKLDAKVTGPGIIASDLEFNLDGDAKEISLGDKALPFIDAAAVMNADGTLNISVINRSPDQSQKVNLKLPENYIVRKQWMLTNADLNSANEPANRKTIIPEITEVDGSENSTTITINACGLFMIQCVAKPAAK